MDLPKLLLAGRGTTGVFIKEFGKFEDFIKISKVDKEHVKALAFGKTGDHVAFNDGSKVKILLLPECRFLFEIDYPRTIGLHFSPLGNMLSTWEPHGAKKSSPNDPGFNLRVFDIKSEQCVKGFHQKRQIGWQLQWTDNEQLVARVVNNEVHFYADNCFDTIVNKIHLQKVTEFSLSTIKSPNHVACFVHGGTSGQPSSIKLFCYPNFEGSNAVIASKSLFKADKAELKWNALGSACLVLVSVDTDKSGSSYYGEQTLHLLTTKGVSCHVQLAKNGPIYSVQWNPNSTEFCVIYGFMPAKATLFNLKAETVFDFGTSPRNLIYYNAFGNLLLLAGFGNLNGNIEIWDMQHKKEIVRTLARDTTCLEWCPDGEHFLTATLAPRLRVGNGFKIWHYTGKVIYEFNCDKDVEMWEILWRPFNRMEFKENKLIYNSSQNVAAEKPVEVYRPPSARGISTFSTLKVHDDFEKPSNLKDLPENLSKAALKNKKKRDARKAKKENVTDEKLLKLETNINKSISKLDVEDPETEKKIKTITKKLDQIKILKQQQIAGKQLEKNQLEKIKMERELCEELRKLAIRND